MYGLGGIVGVEETYDVVDLVECLCLGVGDEGGCACDAAVGRVDINAGPWIGS